MSNSMFFMIFACCLPLVHGGCGPGPRRIHELLNSLMSSWLVTLGYHANPEVKASFGACKMQFMADRVWQEAT